MNEQEAWDMYFMSIAGWYFHPGNKKCMLDHLDLCETMADLMLERRKERWLPSQEA